MVGPNRTAAIHAGDDKDENSHFSIMDRKSTADLGDLGYVVDEDRAEPVFVVAAGVAPGVPVLA